MANRAEPARTHVFQSPLLLRAMLRLNDDTEKRVRLRPLVLRPLLLLKKLEQRFGLSVRRKPGRIYIEAPRSKQPD